MRFVCRAVRGYGRLFLLLMVWLAFQTPAFSEARDQKQLPSPDDNGVAAIVNGVEISRAELEKRMSAAFGDNPIASAENLKAATLRSLIQEQLSESLISPKEITPAIQGEIDTARRRILLNHFLDKNALRHAQAPTEKEVPYIAENPGYFDKRKTYHYFELIIKADSPAIARAIIDRLQQLVILREPSSKDMQLVRDWLQQNNVVFGESSVWRSTEQIPIETLKTIDLLDQSNQHVSIERAKLAFKVIVLFGAYPDPLTPELSKFDAYQRLANASVARARSQVMDAALATADIEITDDALAKLILPKPSGAPRSKAHPLRKLWSFDASMLLLAWSFLALVLGPITTLHQFYVHPRRRTDTPPNRLVYLSYHSGARLAGVVVGALALMIPAALIILDHVHDRDLELVRSAFVGVAAAIFLAYLFKTSSFLKSLLASRGASFLAVFLFQMFLIVTLDPFSKI